MNYTDVLPCKCISRILLKLGASNFFQLTEDDKKITCTDENYKKHTFFFTYFRLNILQYPYIPIIFNNPRGSWAPVFIFSTVINGKIPLCSFNNTFNSWFTFVEPPYLPHPDLTPDWTPTTPTPTFFSFIISSSRGSHLPDPHPITPSTFQFLK